jgi:hypothetical protein
LKNEAECVRDAALRGLDAMEDALPADKGHPLYMQFVQRIWVAKHDPITENRILADNLWEKTDLETYMGLDEDLVQDVVFPVSASVRSSAAKVGI